MIQARLLLPAIFLFGGPACALASDSLPLVRDVEFREMRRPCERLLEALADVKSPFPAQQAKALTTILLEGGKDPESAVKQIQELLDPYCLIQVTINPESRVKAARGPAHAEMPLDREKFFLVKVHNEAGVTHPLKVAGSQMRSARWLEAEVYSKAKERKGLAGQKLEYVILRLKARQRGKREATLIFDVGQGTQDLGFRAEVPILFSVMPGESKSR